MASVKRRLACPQTAMQLWDAISFIRSQKQITTEDRIAKYLQKKHNLNPEDFERQLSFAIRDKLVLRKKNLGNKGSKVGVEQEAHRLPKEPPEKDGHDWYCFECHRGGEVIMCSVCSRVYHNFCIKEDLTSSEVYFKCSICKFLTAKSNFKMKRDEVNNLLSYTCLRLKEKVCLTKDLHRMPSPDDEAWRSNYLIYEKMDLLTMEEKTKANEYSRLEQFQVDAQTIVHNVVIYYGVHSSMADMARQMLRDCIYDLGEIRQCRDCYRMSNEKIEKYWFCQPCEFPHELVFARQKGFPFWPAKVIRKNNGVYDVRFFGGYHQRANIDKDQIRSIKMNIQQLTPKRSSALNKALDELRRHQQLLDGEKPTGSSKSDQETEDAKEPPEQNNSENENNTPPEQNNSELEKKPPAKKRAKKSSSQNKNSRHASGTEERPHSPDVILPDPVSPGKSELPIKIEPDLVEKVYRNVENNSNGVEDGEASRDEAPSSSSQKKPRRQECQAQDDNNVVTSSSQESPCARVSVCTQTHKKLLTALIMKEVALKTANTPAEKPLKCNCEEKFLKLFQQEQEQVRMEHKLEKERICQELTETLRREFEGEKGEELSRKIEKIRAEAEGNQQKEVEKLQELHERNITEVEERLRQEISETKKKQWCYNCELEAIYHCCWNTSYCSVECQQTHWHKEHKRTCRRKR